MTPKRFFSWPAHSTTRHGFISGWDEFGNRTFGLMTPWGSWFTCLNIPLKREELP
jgi:hypothetical protein